MTLILEYENQKYPLMLIDVSVLHIQIVQVKRGS